MGFSASPPMIVPTTQAAFIFEQNYLYRPYSEASEGYVFIGVCHSVTGMLYSGKQTDATVIEL